MARRTESGVVNIDHPGDPEELVRTIFAHLAKGQSISLTADESDSAAIIHAVIIHTFGKFHLHADVRCTISNQLTFAVVASAPGTQIEMSYWYENPNFANYKNHNFAQFHAPFLISGAIKNQIVKNIKEPEIAIAHSLNHEADKLRVRQGVTADITQIAYSPRSRTTTTAIIPIA